MKKREIKYVGILVSILVLYVIFEYTRPQPINWNITYSGSHTIPFGGMVLDDMLDDYFEDGSNDSFLSGYELVDTLFSSALMVVTDYYGPDQDDLISTMNWVYNGSELLVASEYCYDFLDTLGLEMEDALFDTLFFENFRDYDSSYIKFVNPEISAEKFWYSSVHLGRYFTSIDTAKTNILAVNEKDMPVLVEVAWGDGKIILSSTPMALTNYYILRNQNHKFADYLFSYVSSSSIHRTEYYHLGRMEPPTPIRFILSNRALKWAYYITIFSVLIFIIFRAKRKQRIIPIIRPLRNATRDFTMTVGNLYMHHRDHRDAAEKKVTYFLEYIRSHFFLDTNVLDEEFYEKLAHKSGMSRQKVNVLFKLIIHFQSTGKISKEGLMDLNTKVDEFYLRFRK